MSNNIYSTFTDVNTLGEFGLIDALTKDLTLVQLNTLKGVGDDGAVITNTNEVTVVSTDTLVEGIHFDLMYTDRKSVV